jgi:FkbM family methyltransferase
MSQLGADRWVLSKYSEDFKGYFVDVGCGDAINLSNTYELEKRGWKGICIDANPRNFDQRTNSVVVKAVVYSEKDKEVDFVVPQDPDYSAISSCLDKHKDHVMRTLDQQVRLKTSLLQDILELHNAPAHINYLNLDIEGAEYDVLKTFPFEKYTFDLMSVEHNYEEPKSQQIVALLEKHGYTLYKQVEWDYWFTRT